MGAVVGEHTTPIEILAEFEDALTISDELFNLLMIRTMVAHQVLDHVPIKEVPLSPREMRCIGDGS